MCYLAEDASVLTAAASIHCVENCEAYSTNMRFKYILSNYENNILTTDKIIAKLDLS